MKADPRWDPDALEDLQHGHDWYELRQPGLGRQLAIEVDEAISKAVRHPFVPKIYEHPNLPAQPEVRNLRLKRFIEYGVVYTVVDDTFWIVAVAHAKRKPGYWVGRIRRLPDPAQEQTAE